MEPWEEEGEEEGKEEGKEGQFRGGNLINKDGFCFFR